MEGVSAKEASDAGSSDKINKRNGNLQNHVITDTDLDKIGGDKDICKFYLEGSCRFGDECFNYHLGNVPQTKVRKSARPGHRSNRSDSDSSGDEERRARMKTAHDVINRIKWDSDFDQDNFTIGYIDRFKGLVEAQFSTFTWEDLASLDWETFAIPQHRIQYFKYRNEKVWEKGSRMDLVFGSTGSTRDIVDVMTQIDHNHFSQNNS